MRVTIKSIARDLGISHMTVSRALSGHPNVQEETRKAVQKRAAELGYVKNAAATAMRGDASPLVGLLLPNIRNEFYARFANDLARACDAGGFQLIIHLTDDDPQSEVAMLTQLREVQARAVIMVPAPADNGDAAAILGDMRTVQLIRRRRMTGAEAAVLVHDGAAIRAAVAHLARQGHLRIGYIGADRNLSSGRERLEAFRAGLEAEGLPDDDGLTRTGAPSFEMGRAEAEALIGGGRATALVCGGFEISNGALNAALTGGVALAGQGGFGFVGYGDPAFYRWIGGGVSTIRIPVAPLVGCALDLLQADHMPAAPHAFAAELVVRAS